MSLRSSIFSGVFLIIAVFFLNYFFAQDFFGLGLVNEDIPYLRDYKADHRIVDENYLVRIYKTWVNTGFNWAHQILYMGTLDEFFPYNWELIQKLNFVWKVLASLSIFPTLWVLTKRKFLAASATLIYAILPSANGALGINTTGTEYWGIIFLNLFIISYYFLIKNQKSIKLLLLSFILLYLAVFSAPMRMIPTFVLLGLTEIILVTLKISKFKMTLLRLIIYLTPFYLAFRLVDPGTYTRGNPYNNSIREVLVGNWQLMLTPLAGIGFMLLTSRSISLLGGNPNLSDLGSYFSKLISHGLVPLLLIITLILALIISHKPKRFILVTIFLNILFQTLIFIFNTHYLTIPKDVALPYNGTLEFTTIPAILGSYVLSIALVTGFEWYKDGKKDKILLLIFIAPILSLAYISATWFSVGKHYAYENPVHRYLTVPAVGVTIFISAILVRVFKRIQTSKRIALLYGFFLAISFLYLISFSYNGNQYFKMIRSLGEDMVSQKYIQEKFFNLPVAKKDRLLIYYEPRLVSEEDRYWYTALNYGRMILWLYLHKYYNSADKKINGCLGWVDNGFVEFKKIYKYSNNKATFTVLNAFCTKDSVLDPTAEAQTFSQDDFFAFTLKGDQVVDITQEVLERLRGKLDNSANPL